MPNGTPTALALHSFDQGLSHNAINIGSDELNWCPLFPLCFCGGPNLLRNFPRNLPRNLPSSSIAQERAVCHSDHPHSQRNCIIVSWHSAQHCTRIPFLCIFRHFAQPYSGSRSLFRTYTDPLFDTCISTTELASLPACQLDQISSEQFHLHTTCDPICASLCCLLSFFLAFDDDEEEGVDGLPTRQVPFYHVVPLPQGHRQ